MLRTRWLQVVPAVVALFGSWVLVTTVGKHDPLGAWLSWRYLSVMGQACVFAVSALAGGHWVLGRLGLRRISLRERLVLSFGAGVALWALLIVVLGLAHALGRVTFFAIPLGLTALGGPGVVRALRRALRLKRRLRVARPSWVEWAVRAFGAICVFGVWLPLLMPRNILYDAWWYHLPLAEQYAAVGAIFRLDEGWFNGVMPHLASYLYTWAFLSPVNEVFDAIVLAAHLEFVLFVATLASLPVLIDLMLPRPRLKTSWVAFFLFPGIFVYDSSLGCGADHVLAFWAVPLALSLRRFWRQPTRSSAVLVGLFAGAAALTKYQAAFLLAGPALALGLGLVASLVRRRGAFVKGLVWVAVVAAVVSAPHWLLNAVWHHNPVYPHLSNVFPSTPMVEGIDTSFTDKAWRPKGTLREKLTDAALATAKFGFEAHDWDTFHGERPVFGSLFLIAVALLPFVTRRRAIGALALATWLAVPIWFLTQHQDRYLQALVPWAAVVVAVVFAGVWRRSTLARPVLLGLMGFQLLHTADLWTLPAHGMLHAAPIHALVDLIASSKREAPDDLIAQHFAISRARKLLPRDASVLIHDQHLHLGLGRRAVRDHVSRQGGINWALLGSTRNAAAFMEQLGVTHLYWLGTPLAFSAIGDDVVFYRLAQLSGAGATSLGDGSFIAPIDKARVQSDTPTVLVMVCATERMTPLELNRRWEPLYFTPCEAPVVPDDLDAQIAASEVVVVDSRKHPQVHPRLAAEFMQLFDRYGFKVWGRR
ncbi:MAG: hypothetical protein ABTQ32_03740 [Myxococcaceae bacterium]